MKPIIGLYGIQDRQDGPHPLETHDHGLCRLEDGRVVRHMTLERWTRRRYDNRLHEHIDELVSVGFLQRGEDVVVASADSFVGRAFISRSGRWRVEADTSPLSAGLVRARAHVMHRDVEAYVVPHELAHLGASLPFLGSWEEDTLLVHVDGAASQSCCSAWLWRGGRLALLDHGWETAEAVAGYATNNLAQMLVGHSWQTFLAVPGKLMGLAAWGEVEPAMCEWLDRHAWFSRLREGPAAFLEAARRELGWTGELTPLDPLIRGIAACFQWRFEEAVLAYVRRFAERTSARRLVLAGGGALNLSTNQRLVESGWFERVFVPPCAGDDGLALGAASITSLLLQHRPMHEHGPFLNDVGAEGLGDLDDTEVIVLADAIASGRVVASCLGNAEVGPRALGHRSLLTRPMVADAARVSVELKRREPWRPVSPMILRELADELFFGAPSRSSLAPYMLGRFRARERALADAPGGVHVDGTARVQTVGDERELRPLRRLLEALWSRHRIPCVINTSFNRQGEPLVQTTEQAREAATAMGVDLLWHSSGVEVVGGAWASAGVMGERTPGAEVRIRSVGDGELGEGRDRGTIR